MYTYVLNVNLKSNWTQRLLYIYSIYNRCGNNKCYQLRWAVINLFIFFAEKKRQSFYLRLLSYIALDFSYTSYGSGFLWSNPSVESGKEALWIFCWKGRVCGRGCVGKFVRGLPWFSHLSNVWNKQTRKVLKNNNLCFQYILSIFT